MAPDEPNHPGAECLDRSYRVALAHIPGIGPKTTGKLLARFGSAEAVWRAPVDALTGAVGARHAAAIANARCRLDPDELLGAVASIGAVALFPVDGAYPPLLATIHAPPAVLFARGRLELLPRPGVAVVGTRRVTGYGRRVTGSIVRDLVAEGLTIVSGMAAGVDTVAHESALDEGGDTVAVLGGGVDVAYPVRNARLLERLANEGLVVSETPPGVAPVPGSFPRRNRVIAGLTLGTVVTEAGKPSGALITAEMAAEEGRLVWAVPGPVDQPSYEGCHHLLRLGACLTRHAGDVTSELPHEVLAGLRRDLDVPELQPGLPGSTGHEAGGAEGRSGTGLAATSGSSAGRGRASARLAPDEQAVLAALTAEALHVDALGLVAGLPPHRLSRCLGTLELKGLVEHRGAMIWAATRPRSGRIRPPTGAA